MKNPKTLRTVIPVVLNSIRQGATMMSVMGYRNNFGEVADFGIVFHVDYIKAVKKALSVWRSRRPLDPLEAKALDDLIASYSLTLKGPNPRATSADSYRRVTDGKALIRSVKWHDGGAAVHFWGFEVHKRIIKPGIYPLSRRSNWTICRERLIGLTPLGGFRQFKIEAGRFDRIGVERLTLKQKDLLRELT